MCILLSTIPPWIVLREYKKRNFPFKRKSEVQTPVVHCDIYGQLARPLCHLTSTRLNLRTSRI